jgi:tannase
VSICTLKLLIIEFQLILLSVGGLTDGGFGNFDTQFSSAALLANGTVNWQATYMFGKTYKLNNLRTTLIL